MSEFYTFDCGCKVKIIEENKNSYKLKIDYEDILYSLNYDNGCPKVWEMLAEGKAKGVFQLEGYLGKHWSMKFQPESIEEIAILVAIIRPSCLQAVSDGKNMTQHIVDRKHNVEPTVAFDPSLEEILRETYQTIVFQEDSIRISIVIAGFSEEDADNLRKAIGKKDAKLMSQLRSKFIDGCNKVGKISEEKANKLFDWIQESQRYCFNKCISGNSLVKTKENYYKIIDINIGDEVLTPFGYKKVVQKYYNGSKVCRCYIFSNYKMIECTEDHKVMTKDGMIQISKVGNRKVKTVNGFENIIHISDPFIIDTYDIEIDCPNHVYYANGIAVSNSHATSYGQVGYLTAFTKVHFPIHFFASYLTFAREKLDSEKEIKELIEEAKKFDITTLLPKVDSILENDCNMSIDKNVLRFGIRMMKNVGGTAIEKLKILIDEKEKELGKISDWTWYQLLYHILPNVNSQSVNALITGGVLDKYHISRSRMLLEYQKIKELSKLQIKKLIEINKPLVPALHELYELVNKGQKQKIFDLIKLLEKSTHSTEDRPAWISYSEKEYFGVSVTYNPLDILKNGSVADTTCKEFEDGKTGEMSIAGEIQSTNSFKIKTGKNTGKTMLKCQLNDGTSIIDCVLFAKNYESCYKYITDGNLVCIFGKRSDSNSLIIDTVQEIY